MANPMTSPGEADLLASMEAGLWEVRVQWEWMQQKVQQPMSGEDADRPPRPAAERPEEVVLKVHKQQKSHNTPESRCCLTGHGISQKHEVNQKEEPMMNAWLWAPGESAPRRSGASAASAGEGPLVREGQEASTESFAKKGISASKVSSGKKEPCVSKETSVRKGPLVRIELSVRKALAVCKGTVEKKGPLTRKDPLIRKEPAKRKVNYITASDPCPDDGLIRSLKTELLEFIECMLDAVKYTSAVTVEEVNKLRTSVESFLDCETHVQSKGPSPTRQAKSEMTDSMIKSKNIKPKVAASQTKSQKRRTHMGVNLPTRGVTSQSECYPNEKRLSSNGTKTTQVFCTCVPHRSQKSKSTLFCKKEANNTNFQRNQNICSEFCSMQNDEQQRSRPVVHCCPFFKNGSHHNQGAACTLGHDEVEHSDPQNRSCTGYRTRCHCITHLSVHRYFGKEEEDNNSKRNGNESTRPGCVKPPVASNTSSEKRSCRCSRYNQLLVNCDTPKAHTTFRYVETPKLQEHFQMTLLLLDEHFFQITCASESMLLQHHDILSAITILGRVPPKSWMSWVDDLLGLITGCLRSSRGFLCLCWETTLLFNDYQQRLIADSSYFQEPELVENCSDARDVCTACLGTQESRQFVPGDESHDISRRNVREQTKVQCCLHHVLHENRVNECRSLRDQTISNDHGCGSRGYKFSGREAAEPSRTFEQVNSFGFKQTRAGEANPHTHFLSAGPEFWSRKNTTLEGSFINQHGMQSNTQNEADFKQTIDFTILHRMGCLLAAALSKAHKIGVKLSQIKRTIDDDTKPRSAAGKRSTVEARRGTGWRTSGGSEEDMLCNCKCDQDQETSLASVTLKCDPRCTLPQHQIQERTTWPSSSSSIQPRSHTALLRTSRESDRSNQKKVMKRGGRFLHSKHCHESTSRKSANNKCSPKKCSHNCGHKNYRVADYLVMTKSCKCACTEKNHSSGTPEATRRKICKHPHKADTETNWFRKSNHPTALTLASERNFFQESDCDPAVGRDQTEGDEYRLIPQELQSSSTIFSNITSSIKSLEHDKSKVSYLSPHYAESQTSISTTMMSVVFSSLQSQYSSSADRSASSSACGSSGPSPAPTTLQTKCIRPEPMQGKRLLLSTDSETPWSEVDGTSGFSFTLSTDESEPTMSPFCDTHFPPRNWLQLKREGEALLGEWRVLSPELLRARFMDRAKDPVPVSSHDCDRVREVLVSLLATVGNSLRGVVGEINLQHRQWGRLRHPFEAAGSEGMMEAAMTEGNLVVKEEVKERETRDRVTDPSNGFGLEANETVRNPGLPPRQAYVTVKTDTPSSVSAVDAQENVTVNDDERNNISVTAEFPQFLDGNVSKASDLPEPQRCQNLLEKQIRSDPCVIQDNNGDSKSPVVMQGAVNEEPLEFGQNTMVSVRPDGADHNSLQQPVQEKQIMERGNEEEYQKLFIEACKQSPSFGHAVRQQDVPQEATDLPRVISVNQPPPQTPILFGKQQLEVDEENLSRKGASSASCRQQSPSPHNPEQPNRQQHSTSSEYLHALATADALLGSHRAIFLKLLLLTNLDSTAALPRLLSQLGGSLLTCLEQGKLLVMARPSLCPETSRSGSWIRPSAAPCVPKRQEREAGPATGNIAPPAISSKEPRSTNNEVKFDAKKRSTDANSELSLDKVDKTPEDLVETIRTFAIHEINPNPSKFNPHYADHALSYHHSAAMALAHQLAVLLLR